MKALASLWTTGGRSGRNASLDGLRGIAILLVIASHASAGRFPLGGMVGVTLFFVLSGYLITTLLLAEQRRHGRVDLRAFYARRAFRLIPALCVMLVVAPLLLWLLRDPQLTAALVPASAIVVFYLADFFRAAGDPLIVYGHTWSLAVEEQFYIIWPALLLLVLTRWLNRRALLVAVFVLAVAFMSWRVVAGLGYAFERADFAFDTNAFALLLGVVLAVRPVELTRPVGTTLTVIAAVGLLAISVLPIAPGTQPYFFGLTVGAPVAAICGVFAVAGARVAAQPWSFRPLVAAGRLSYGLYLWHEILFLATPEGRPLEGVWRGVALPAAVVLALLSWVLVEYPMLQRKRRFERVDVRVVGEQVPSEQVQPETPLPGFVPPSSSAP